jgi:hypothetical protein
MRTIDGRKSCSRQAVLASWSKHCGCASVPSARPRFLLDCCRTHTLPLVQGSIRGGAMTKVESNCLRRSVRHWSKRGGSPATFQSAHPRSKPHQVQVRAQKRLATIALYAGRWPPGLTVSPSSVARTKRASSNASTRACCSSSAQIDGPAGVCDAATTARVIENE